MTFKIGDRVRVYSVEGIVSGNVVGFNHTRDHVSVEYYEDGDTSITDSFHSKQCRKLKPKQRYEWWLNIQKIETGSFKMAAGEHYLKDWFNNPYGEFIRTTPPPSKEGWIKVREVKE